MNKDLENRVRNNLGANILVEYDDQERAVGYQQVKLMKASEIVSLEQTITKNKKIIAAEQEEKNKKLELEKRELAEKQRIYNEEQEYMNRYSLTKFITVFNFAMLKGLVNDESFFEQDLSYLFEMLKSIERSTMIKEIVESNEEFKKLFDALGGE